jgi:hypothetical protein
MGMSEWPTGHKKSPDFRMIKKVDRKAVARKWKTRLVVLGIVLAAAALWAAFG